MSKQDITANTMAQYWNVRDDLKDKTLDELKAIVQADKLPFGVCALNITGDLNLGIMMRTASLMGAERFIVYGKPSFDRRSCVGAQNYIEIVKAGSLIPGTDEINYASFNATMVEHRYWPLFFDTDGEALADFDMDVAHKLYKQHGVKYCLVFGNEGLGIPLNVLQGHRIVTIAQRGVLRSLNVGAAASIAIHHFSNYFSKVLS